MKKFSAKKRWPRKCKTKYCRGVVHETTRSPFCSKCKMRKHKEKNPLRYAYTKLKSRAKERGHEFKLTFEQYKQFALETGYLEKKGKTADSLSIDRIDPSRGYEVGNIRAVTLRENARLFLSFYFCTLTIHLVICI